jgi:hypothetical protein
MLRLNMTSVGPPQLPAEEPGEESQSSSDLGSSAPSSDAKNVRLIHWTVDLGEELTVGDITGYLGAFEGVINIGEWLGLMMAKDDEALSEVPAGQVVLQQLRYGSPLSIILSAPKQLAEGIVCVLDFVVNIPANVKERWAKAKEAEVRAALLEHLSREVETGHIKLTRNQIFQLLMSTNLPALQTVTASGQIGTFGWVNPETGAARWHI